MFGFLTRRAREREAREREKMAALERAEGDLRDLKERKTRALGELDARHRRNHWGESIVEMIQGA